MHPFPRGRFTVCDDKYVLCALEIITLRMMATILCCFYNTLLRDVSLVLLSNMSYYFGNDE